MNKEQRIQSMHEKASARERKPICFEDSGILDFELGIVNS